MVRRGLDTLAQPRRNTLTGGNALGPSDNQPSRGKPLIVHGSLRPEHRPPVGKTRMRQRRQKVFGPGQAIPLDRNAKARVMAFARAYSARRRQPGQHKGPITRAFIEVLGALLWGFHNQHTGRCFPSYEAIAAKAGCARSTVAAALQALEFAGVLTWQHRITRIQERCTDLFGRRGWRWRVIRTSNAYAFADPSKSENRPGTQFQDIYFLVGDTGAAPRPASKGLNRTEGVRWPGA